MNEAVIDTTGSARSDSLPIGVQGMERIVPLVFLYDDTKQSKVFITKLLHQITNLTVSYSISAATAISFEIIDPGLQITLNNYFQIGQTFIFKSHNSSKLQGPGPATSIVGMNDYIGYFMEVADVQIDQSQGNSPIIKVSGYTKAIQQMKRDRNPSVIKGTAHDFVINAAKKYGLKSVVQETSASRQIVSASGDKQADSLWTVLTNLAGQSKDKNKNPYTIFESDGTLFFGTQQWLMYKWGHDSYEHGQYNAKKNKTVNTTRKVTYLHYPPRIVNGVKDSRLVLLQLPSMHKAENDPLEGDGSCIVDRRNGCRLRPGMTVNVGDIPFFTDDFIIQSVDYQEFSSDPVSVSFATPPRQEVKIKHIEVGKIYPGSVEWGIVEGLQSVNPSVTYPSKTPEGTPSQYE